MKGINKVILVGTCGNDPESHTFPDGNIATRVSIATSESWKDKQTGQKQERTEWHRLSFIDRGNRKLGSISGEYLKKGSKVYVEGKLQTKKYQGKDGSDRYTTEIIVDEMQFLSDPREQTAAPQAQSATPPPRPAAPTPAPTKDYGDFDDNIPF